MESNGKWEGIETFSTNNWAVNDVRHYTEPTGLRRKEASSGTPAYPFGELPDTPWRGWIHRRGQSTKWRFGSKSHNSQVVNLSRQLLQSGLHLFTLLRHRNRMWVGKNGSGRNDQNPITLTEESNRRWSSTHIGRTLRSIWRTPRVMDCCLVPH